MRNALKDGLALEETLGANPFRFGFIGSTDTHNALGGSVAEIGWDGGHGNDDSSPARQIAKSYRDNPGGLAVVWAEENSRDAIFAALRRRETYATSGTRPVVRFFAGDLGGVRLRRRRLRAHAPTPSGTPMGGELGAVRGRCQPDASPCWRSRIPARRSGPAPTCSASRSSRAGSTPRDRRTSASSTSPAAPNGAGVDPATCAPTGAGAGELCAMWRDPEFAAGERAFYYARVLENPTCRWSTRVCKAAGVDPLAPDCAAQAAAASPEFADCCRGPGDDATAEPVIQERAWTSAVWYRPEGIARLRGRVRASKRRGRDVLSLRIQLGAQGAFDPQRDDLVVRVTDDDEVFAITIPAGTLGPGKHRRRPAQLAQAVLRKQSDGGALLALRTKPLRLPHADRGEHMMTVSLTAGVYRVSHTRLWLERRGALVTGDQPK